MEKIDTSSMATSDDDHTQVEGTPTQVMKHSPKRKKRRKRRPSGSAPVPTCSHPSPDPSSHCCPRRELREEEDDQEENDNVVKESGRAPTLRLPPFEDLDTDDEMWTLVTSTKPEPKKSVIYIGNVDVQTTPDRLEQLIIISQYFHHCTLRYLSKSHGRAYVGRGQNVFCIKSSKSDSATVMRTPQVVAPSFG